MSAEPAQSCEKRCRAPEPNTWLRTPRLRCPRWSRTPSCTPGGVVRVKVWVTAETLRVEVEDGSTVMPARRHYAATAGTGRGLQLVRDLADRWGASERPGGKVVWFELGGLAPASHTELAAIAAHATGDAPRGEARVCCVTLRHVPMLMHAAWQEHAATLLREYLLHVLDEDDTILDKHAHASMAMSLLHDQVPTPVLPVEADELMADSIEPFVSADEVVLRIPVESVPYFATLDDLLSSALTEARTGAFLSPPTQPEIEEMRQWICSEVAYQSAGSTTATPWLARTDVRATLVDQEVLTTTYSHLSAVDEPLLVTDGASIIVAVSQAALGLLGYGRADELLGRRVIVVVPVRFHQAHIAGTTMHATNGRDNLLGVPIVVPMVRADGSEVPVHLEVRSQRLTKDHLVFVARFRPA